MRQLEPYNALNTLREIGRPLCFNKKSTTLRIFWSMYYFIVFLISKILHMYPFFLSCTCKNCPSTLQGKSHLCIPFLGIAQPQSQFRHSCVCVRFIYFQDRSTYFLAAERQTNPENKFVNLSQIYECRNWEAEHYTSVLEITVSFLGIHKSEPDIYIGFSPALHLQCNLHSAHPSRSFVYFRITVRLPDFL